MKYSHPQPRHPAESHGLDRFDDGTLNMLATSVLLIDEQWCVLAMNLAGETLFDASATRALGESLELLTALDEEWRDLLHQAQTEEFPVVRRGIMLRLRSGHQQAVDLTVSPIARGSGIHLLLELVAVDRLYAISEGETIWESQESLRHH